MSSLEEQFSLLQQQFAALQAQLGNASAATPMQSEDATASIPQHSFGTRPHYDWSPSATLTEFMELDVPLHTSKPLSDTDRKSIIEAYPPMAHIDYKAPTTIPTAERAMNKGQKLEDNSLKHLQYLLSAVFRPLDILTHEMFTHDSGNPNLERYGTMLRDIRHFLIHVCSSMTHQRNNIALHEFQSTLIQQTAARRATREATGIRRQHRRSTLAAGWFQQQQQQHQLQHHRQHYLSSAQQQEKQQPFSPINLQTTTATSISATSTSDPVGGRLSQFYPAWANILTTPLVKNIIRNGYNIHFHTIPPTTTTPSSIQPFGTEQVHLIDQAITDLLNKQAIKPVSDQEVRQTPGFYSSLFVIPKKDGGIRPVFNLKRLNQYLHAPHFKMETIKEVTHMIQKNDYLLSIDLSDVFFSYCPPSGLPPTPSPEVVIPSLPVLYSCLRFGYSPLYLCQNMPPHFGMGTIPRNAYLGLSGRLDSGGINQGTGTPTGNTGSTTITETGMDCQFQEVSPPTDSATRTPRFLIEYHNNAGISSTEEIAGSTPLYQTNSGPPSTPDPPSTTQHHHANTGSNLCNIPGSPLHSPPVILQESDGEIRQGLGSSCGNGPSQSGRAPMVVSQPEEVEWTVVSSLNTNRDRICGRQQHRLGLQLETSESLGVMDTRRSIPINQLAGTSSSVLCVEDISDSNQLHDSHSHGQHYQPVIYQQPRRHSFSSDAGTSDSGLELVHSAQHHDTSSTYPRYTQYRGRYGISENILQKPMANSSVCLSANQRNVGTLLDRPLRRQDNQVITKVRVLATGSGRYPYGCLHDSLEHLDEAVREPALEPDLSCPPQDSTGETSSSIPSSPVLAERHLVPPSPTAGSYIALDAPLMRNSDDLSQDPSPSDSSELDALRMAIIRDQLWKANLNEQAIADLLAQKFAKTATNRLYQLVNFLAYMRQQHDLQVTTLKTLRAAVGHLHDDPNSLPEAPLVNSYFDSLSRQAAPVSIHRDTVDISPSIEN
ncbi:hypothetical protein [Parasitella parasitica]|uniref:Reverse transcriptase domain-containing protein n=1 Tax=Parasitella parasitica TaxID=35722 RepID=A0A0B7N9A0_9FUNG|nr:hypothetical protein [Parasitella parasitica]